jgi:hypothetical protein
VTVGPYILSTPLTIEAQLRHMVGCECWEICFRKAQWYTTEMEEASRAFKVLPHTASCSSRLPEQPYSVP